MQIMLVIQTDISTSESLNIPQLSAKESQFRFFLKCQTKFECLIYEMLFIKEINPSLNTQADFIRTELFFWIELVVFM